MYTGAGRIGLLRPRKLPNLVEGRDGVRDWSCGKAGLFTITPIKWSFQVRPEALFFSWGLRNHNQPVPVLSGAASSQGGAGPRQSILQVGTGHLLVPARHSHTQDGRAMARKVRLRAPHGIRGRRRGRTRRVQPKRRLRTSGRSLLTEDAVVAGFGLRRRDFSRGTASSNRDCGSAIFGGCPGRLRGTRDRRQFWRGENRRDDGAGSQLRRRQPGGAGTPFTHMNGVVSSRRPDSTGKSLETAVDCLPRPRQWPSVKTGGIADVSDRR